MDICDMFGQRMKKDIIFAIFGIYIFSLIIETTMLVYNTDGSENRMMLVSKILKYGSVFLFAVPCLKHAYESKSYSRIALIAGTIFGISFICNHNKTMIMYLIVFFALWGQNTEKLAGITCFIKVSVLLLFIILSQTGVVLDFVNYGDRTRHFMGFAWTTHAPILCLFALAEYIIAKKGKLNYLSHIFFLILSIYLYIMTRTRYTVLITLAILFTFIFFQKRIGEGVWIRRHQSLMVAVPWICAVFSFVMMLLYNPKNDIWESFNTLLSSRLSLERMALQKYGITLFGQQIEWIGWGIAPIKAEYNYVDCHYLQTLFEFGLIPLCVLLVMYSLLMYYSIKNEKYYLTWLGVLVMLFGITEPRLFNLTYNIFPLLMMTEISEYKEKSSKKFIEIRES